LIAGELPDQRQFNYPLDYQALIEGNGARYQVYFRVRGDRLTHEEPSSAAA
jgi:hypothetical protein